MPLRIELRSLSGKVLGVTGEAVDTSDATLPELAFDEFPLLSCVDRYGYTVFNHIQMQRLAVEIEKLESSAPPQRKTLLGELRRLCEQGGNSPLPDVQLWFLGD